MKLSLNTEKVTCTARRTLPVSSPAAQSEQHHKEFGAQGRFRANQVLLPWGVGGLSALRTSCDQGQSALQLQAMGGGTDQAVPKALQRLEIHLALEKPQGTRLSWTGELQGSGLSAGGESVRAALRTGEGQGWVEESCRAGRTQPWRGCGHPGAGTMGRSREGALRGSVCRS